MNMIGACWMVRSLGEAVSALSINESYGIIAGGWNGRLNKWAPEGELQWSIQLPDRIGSISCTNDLMVVTAGLHVVAIKSDDGEILWQVPLEGSADQAVILGSAIYATSSVYDIEHNDFIDSAIWCFDKSGKLLWDTHMDEKPWVLKSFDGQITLGLGRPKMGAATLDAEGKVKHIDLDSKSPVTIGVTTSEEILFGHANGDVTTPSSRLITGAGQSVESMVKNSSNYLFVSTEKEIMAKDIDNKTIWSFSEPSSLLCIGFKIEDLESLWSVDWNGAESSLKVRDSLSGDIITSMNHSKIRNLKSRGNRVVVGDEHGEVFVWDMELFNRRTGKQESVEDSEHKKSMRERLRALKKR